MRIGPLIALRCLWLISLGHDLGKHGETRTNVNAWYTFLSLLLNGGLIIWAIV